MTYAPEGHQWRHDRHLAAPPAEGGGGTSERRGSPTLRPRVQAGFERLLSMLQKAKRTDVLKTIGDLRRVDDVLRDRPAQVPILLELAWQLRDTPDFQGFFQRADGKGPVTERGQLIAPCERTYDQIIRAHLHGAARMVFERRERSWIERRARAERAQQRERRKKEPRGGLQSKLMAPIKGMLEGEADIDPDQFRPEYPGYGLYAVLKPSLRASWQFGFLETYARLGTPQARAFGHLLDRVKSPELLETLVNLSTDDVGLIRTVCRVFIEARHKIKLDKSPSWQLSAETRQENEAAEKRISELEGDVVESLILEHPAAIGMIQHLGINVGPDVVRRLTPIFGNEIWSVMEDAQELENARSVPDHLLPILGSVSRYAAPDISTILGQIQDRALAKDLMTMARQAFPDEELARYLGDLERRPIWNTLPTKFNNTYRYQRDAQSGGNLRNEDDLRTVSKGIFQSLRLGHLETF